MAERTFKIRAAYGKATIEMLVLSSKVEDIVERWTDRLKTVDTDDLRAAFDADALRATTREIVVDSLKHNKHHDDLHEASLVSSALIWLTVTGEMGSRLLPLMKAGDMTINYEITAIDPKRFNFQLGVDEKTKAALLN